MHPYYAALEQQQPTEQAILCLAVQRVAGTWIEAAVLSDLGQRASVDDT